MSSYNKKTRQLVSLLKGTDNQTVKEDKAPPGFVAIPNSKHGGYRKKVGGKFVYWYPDGEGKSTYTTKKKYESTKEEIIDRLLEAFFSSKGLKGKDLSMKEVRQAIVAKLEEEEKKAKEEKEGKEEGKEEDKEEGDDEQPKDNEEAPESDESGADEEAPAPETAEPETEDEQSSAEQERDEARAQFRQTHNEWVATQETLQLEIAQEEIERVLKEAQEGGLSDEAKDQIREQLAARFNSQSRVVNKAFLPDRIWEILWKAKAVKYIRRVPTGDPKRPWKYFYRESASAREAKEGESIKLGDDHVLIKSIEEDGSVVVEHPGFKEPITFKPDEWRNELARYYGKTYTKSAERRARQAINAVLRLVPKEKLAELKGKTDAERLKDLEKRMPELYKRLEKAFSRAGMSPIEAKQVLSFTLVRKGWKEEARASLIGNVITQKGGWIAKHYRRIAVKAENIASGEAVEPGHVQASIDVMYGIRTYSIEKVLKTAGEAVEKTLKMVLAAKKGGVVSPETAADILKELLGSEALQKIAIIQAAEPGIVKDPKVQAIEKGLGKAITGLYKQRTGNDTRVFVAGEGGKPVALPGKYKLVSAKAAIPSHDPVSFAKNKKYPEGLQERAYHRDKSEQDKVIRNAGRMEAAFVVNTNPDALNGPPIVTAEGIVLGGNSRTMSMQRVYADGGEKAEQMRKYLRENAAQMGFSPEDVDAIEDPILVREVDTTGHDEKVLVRAMNESFIQAMDPRTMQVAMGRRLDEKAMSALADNMTDEDSLRGFLDSDRAKPFLASLNRVGVIDERNRNQYMNSKTGKLNEDGKTLVERILLGRVIEDPDLLSNTMPSMVGSMARAVPFMVQAEAHGEGYNVRDDLRYALQAFNRMNDLGISPGRAKGKELDNRLREVKAHFDDLFEGKHPVLTNPRAEAMFDNLVKRGGPRQIASTFKEYARLASKNPEGQATMFGSMSPAEVFNQSVSISSKKDSGDVEKAFGQAIAIFKELRQ